MKSLKKSNIILITGGIGAGKSVVATICRQIGFTVYDCDIEAKRIINRSDSLKEKLQEICGKNIYDKSGKLKVADFSRLLFSDSLIREKINSFVHKEVISDVITKAKKNKSPFFVEAAISSTELGDIADEIWFVDAPEEVRISRVIVRSKLSLSEIKARIMAQKNQWDGLDYNKTHIIYNDNSESLLIIINNLLKQYNSTIYS